jgi:peptidoglycan/LPS O-acetylase OafA/YrhL
LPIDAAPRVHRSDIDALRALAILSVVFYHAGTRWLPGGFTGVDIFFVISGYLIGGQIYAELRAGSFNYMRFYQRRAKRILPALFAVLAFTLLAAMVLLSPAEAAQLARDACATTLSVSNILFWGKANYFESKSELNPLLMTWSLGVEEQFYLVVPLLMVLVARIRRHWMLPGAIVVCIASFTFAAVLTAHYPMLVFYLLPARAWELGAGIALAVAGQNRKAGFRSKAAEGRAPAAENWTAATGMILLLAPIFLLTAQSPLALLGLCSSVLGTVLLIASPASWINRQLLSSPPLIFIGRISYSWYLWHWPLLAFLHIVCGPQLPRAAPWLAIVASFAAAVLSWRFIEQPFRSSRRAPAPLLARYALASAALLLIYALVWFGHGVPQRFPALAALEDSGMTLNQDPCLGRSTSDQPNLLPPCSSASANPAIALWGDSHAAALAPGLRAAAAAQGWDFIQLGKASCPPLSGAVHFIPRLPPIAAVCGRFNKRVLELLQSDRRIRIVVLTAFWSAPLSRTWQDGWLTASLAHEAEVPSQEASRALFVDSLAATIRTLQDAGKQLILIEDVPSLEVDPLWRIRSARIPARRKLVAWLGVHDATDPGFTTPDRTPNTALSVALLQQITSALPRVELVDLNSALCPTPTQCTYRSGDKLLYDDSSHLSTDGSIYALRNFRFPVMAVPSK